MRLWPKLKGLISTVLGKTNLKNEAWNVIEEDGQTKVYYKGKLCVIVSSRSYPTVSPLTHSIAGEIIKLEMYILTPFIDTDNTIISPGPEKYTNERYSEILEGIVRFDLFKAELERQQRLIK